MKNGVYILSLCMIVLLTSCSSHYGFTKYMGDDLYYSPDVPAQQAVLSQKRQNNNINQREIDDAIRESRATRMDARNLDLGNYVNTQGELDTQALLNDAHRELRTETRVNKTLYANVGYWIGGFKGNNQDLKEATRIIKRYPEGFANMSNDQDIALNLSVDPDWNVYTFDGRYWWFPSNSNIDLYSQFIFGDYPRYIYTVIWNQPGFNAWDFNYAYNAGWYGSGWNFGFNFGWGNSWYRPYYNSWYNPWWGAAPCYGWNNSWWGPGWNCHPYWHRPHYGHYYPHWGNNHPIVRPPVANKPGHGLRPNHSNGNRPVTGNSGRPTYSNRHEQTTRPNSNAVTRPNSNARPNNSVNRPTGMRPNTSGQSSQQNVNRNPATSNRPVRQPNTATQQRPAQNNTYNNNRSNFNSSPTYNRGTSVPTYNRGASEGRTGGSSGGSGATRRNR